MRSKAKTKKPEKRIRKLEHRIRTLEQKPKIREIGFCQCYNQHDENEFD